MKWTFHLSGHLMLLLLLSIIFQGNFYLLEKLIEISALVLAIFYLCCFKSWLWGLFVAFSFWTYSCPLDPFSCFTTKLKILPNFHTFSSSLGTFHAAWLRVAVLALAVGAHVWWEGSWWTFLCSFYVAVFMMACPHWTSLWGWPAWGPFASSCLWQAPNETFPNSSVEVAWWLFLLFFTQTHLTKLLIPYYFSVFLGFESNNKYEIKNTLGQRIYFAVEDTDCCTRNFCGPSRPFTIRVMDNLGREVITLQRPLRCSSCCFPCCLQEVSCSLSIWDDFVFHVNNYGMLQLLRLQIWVYSELLLMSL